MTWSIGTTVENVWDGIKSVPGGVVNLGIDAIKVSWNSSQFRPLLGQPPAQYHFETIQKADEAVRGLVTKVSEAAWNGGKWVVTHPGESADYVTGLAKRVDDLQTNGGTRSRFLSALPSAARGIFTGKLEDSLPTRAEALAQQGVINAVASTVGMVGDAAEGLFWNNTYRHLYNLPTAVYNLGVPEGEKVPLKPKHKHNYSDDLKDMVQIHEKFIPENAKNSARAVADAMIAAKHQGKSDDLDRRIEELNKNESQGNFDQAKREQLETEILAHNDQMRREIDETYFRLMPYDTTFAASDPNAKYDRVLLYGPQAVADAGAFIVVGTLTGGVGGAALYVVRAGRAVRVAELAGAFNNAAAGTMHALSWTAEGAKFTSLVTGKTIQAAAGGISVLSAAGDTVGAGVLFTQQTWEDIQKGAQVAGMHEATVQGALDRALTANQPSQQAPEQETAPEDGLAEQFNPSAAGLEDAPPAPAQPAVIASTHQPGFKPPKP